MAESADQTAQHRRASWVGLRTLRQRPKVVDHTQSGEPVFEVRSVRLLLRGDAGHFTRLVQCSKCGVEGPGAPVLSAAELDRPAQSVICKACVRAAAVSSPLQSENRVGEAPAPPAPAAAPAPPASAPAQPEQQRGERSVADNRRDARLAAVEGQLQAAMTALRELTASSEAAAARASALEDHVHRSIAGLVELLQAQRSELGAVSGGRDDLAERFERRIGETLAQVGARVTSGEQRVHEKLASLTQMIETQRRELAAVSGAGVELGERFERRIAQAVDQVSADVTSVEQRAHENLVAITHLIETLRSDLDERLDRLLQRVVAGEARLDSLVRSVSAQTSAGAAKGGGLMEALEQQLQEAAARLDSISGHGERSGRAR